MELFFRKYFWVVNLIFLALAAFFAARIVNAIVEQKLRPPVASLLTQETVRKAAAAEKKGISAEALSKLTGIELPKEIPPEPQEVIPASNQTENSENSGVSSGTEEDGEEDDVGLERSSLRAKLVGTTLANVAEWSLASIFKMEDNSTSTYMIGDSILGAEIVAIRLRRVIVINEGRREYIDANEPGGGPVRPAAPPVQKRPNPGEESGIRATAANTYEVPKDEVQKALDNMGQLATQARIVPSFKNGEPQGFKIFAIKPNSLFNKLGIQNGDIIKRVNGFEINSPDKALELYSKLQSSNRIEIEFDRGGAPTRKTYSIR